MKKIVSITIGKRVFSIEEDAYSHLQKYLMDIGEHFKKEDSSGEIISDIEDSISEKLITKKRSLQNAVTANDVDEVISQL
jgi:phage shock protein C